VNESAEPLVSLTTREERALFVRLKREESGMPALKLSAAEQALLMRLEKIFYQRLSISEAEHLMKEVNN
jgi:hypothetical protein